MTKGLMFGLIISALLAGPAVAAGCQQAGGMHQATEQYIATKLACDNMSKFQKDVCLRNADEAYLHAMHQHGQ
ncbi:hypothetical protein QU481_16525 [Crenobacter sp. SG2303]|uniref:Uncharacterized protein n=1 Tax=Crenobacter oryzisoli TaxID=3056844 RepID=A0ABT7XRP9_9NEIS|nr:MULTISPECIES: hypothetical protein [unclassified Crenobacter]MDN0076476.1 hypothetical protein [Crenobacter sp. SG2303]MDN0083230.1 hypothetical protein [Crenobacter sp. SG2305]